MKHLTIASLTLLLVLSACTFSPVVPQAAFDVTATARAVTPPPLPTVVPAVVPTVALPTVTPEPTATPECVIKGNIDEHGNKIYHVPGQLDYSRTKVDPAKGEAMFCSEAAAQAAGFRKAKK
jgi:hypothetical protein